MIEAGNTLRPRQPNRIATMLSPMGYVRAIGEFGRILVRRRALTLEMAKREILLEHSGKALGRFWGVFQPLFLLGVYAFVYGVVFHAHISSMLGAHNYTVYILSGLVPWFAFALSMAKTTNSITSNAALVTQVVFDIEILPAASALASCLPLVLGLGFVLAYLVLIVHVVPVILLLLPLLVALQFVAMCGVGFILASLGTFFKDVRDLVQMSSIVLVFVTPILYIPGSTPSLFRPLLQLNPFAWMTYCYQDVIFYGRFQHPNAWIAFSLGTVLIFGVGYRLFRRLRPYFANVL